MESPPEKSGGFFTPNGVIKHIAGRLLMFYHLKAEGRPEAEKHEESFTWFHLTYRYSLVYSGYPPTGEVMNQTTYQKLMQEAKEQYDKEMAEMKAPKIKNVLEYMLPDMKIEA
jgi:hypothetical protein